jgi:hypothetical protein
MRRFIDDLPAYATARDGHLTRPPDPTTRQRILSAFQLEDPGSHGRLAHPGRPGNGPDRAVAE